MKNRKRKTDTAADPDLRMRRANALRMRNAALGIFLALLVLCTALQIYENRRSALHSCALMLDQTAELITQNDNNFTLLQDGLKEGYIVRARAAAAMLDKDWSAYREPKDYAALAQLLGVDEVHVFDETGTIIASSVPTSYGRNMDEGEQIAYFKAMLQNKGLSLCQDLTPNTDEGREMMYAAVWNADRTVIIQIGVAPDRLLQWIHTNDITRILRRLPLIDSMAIYVVDEDTGRVTASTVSDMEGYQVLDSDRLQPSVEQGQRTMTTKIIRGVKNYVVYENLAGRDILVSYTVKAANADLGYTVLCLALLMAAGYIMLQHTISRYVFYLEKQSRELAYANAAKTDLLHRISHDTRTPINGIQGYIDMADRHPDDVAVQKLCRENTAKALHILLEMMNSILDMSKLESGEVRPDSEPFDLEALLDDVDVILRPQAETCGITYDPGRPGELPVPYVVGSSRYLRQVFMNLVGNAIKYGRDGGYVRLNAQMLSRTEDTVTYRFSCRDNGIGMSPEFQAHMYESFAQEESNARTTYPGVGLGLSIVKKLVDAMGGALTCQSKKGVGYHIHPGYDIPHCIGGSVGRFGGGDPG